MKKKMMKLTSIIAALAITVAMLPASVGAMATKGENLISNSGFENGTASWTKKGNCTLAEETTNVFSGEKSIKITGRSVSNDGVSQKVTFEENSKYIMTVRIMPVSANVTARMRVGTQINPTSVSCSVGTWTQFKYILDTSVLTDLTDVEVYVQTNNTNDIYLDDFEVCKYVSNAPEVPVAGNMLGTNAGFEEGRTTVLGANAATVTLVDEFKANTGNYAALSTNRTANYGGVNSDYINLETDTYYYVSAYAMAAAETTAKARVRLQRQSGTDITNNVTDAAISNTQYIKYESVVYNKDAAKGKVYIQTNEKNLSASNYGVDLYTDDYVLLPITSSVRNGATGVAINSDITLTVPEAITVSTSTLSINNGARITNVARNGSECVVSFSGMNYGTEYTLTLTTGKGNNPTYTFTTEAAPADYVTAFTKSGNTINCEFTNNLNTDKIMLAVAGYNAGGQLKYVEIDVSETTSETLTVTAPADGAYDTVKVFLWNIKTFAPVIDSLSLADIPAAE